MSSESTADSAESTAVSTNSWASIQLITPARSIITGPDIARRWPVAAVMVVAADAHAPRAPTTVATAATQDLARPETPKTQWRAKRRLAYARTGHTSRGGPFLLPPSGISDTRHAHDDSLHCGSGAEGVKGPAGMTQELAHISANCLGNFTGFLRQQLGGIRQEGFNLARGEMVIVPMGVDMSGVAVFHFSMISLAAK